MMTARAMVAALLESDEVDPESYLARLGKAQHCPRCESVETQQVGQVGSMELWECRACGDKFTWSDDRRSGVKFESEDETDGLDFSMDYVDKAHIPWTAFNTITNREWRGLFQSLGWRVRSLYRHRATGKRRYAIMSLLVEPKDSHQVVYQDASLLVDYMYELMEKRFGKKRYDIGAYIFANAYSPSIPGITADVNEIFITVVPPGGPNQLGSRFDDYHPLRGYF